MGGRDRGLAGAHHGKSRLRKSRAAPGEGPALHYLEGVASGPSWVGQRPGEHILTGEPASEIIAFIRGERTALIVMATRGRSGLTRGLLGSVTDPVTSMSPVPVLVVRAESAPPRSEGPLVQEVIVPLDGSELSESALPHGAALAEAFATARMLPCSAADAWHLNKLTRRQAV